MDHPSPPQVEAAQAQLLAAIQSVDKTQVDPLATPWPDLEKSVIKLLGGAFDPNRPDHTAIALGLSALFAARLGKEHGAFWFPNRESLEGAVLGFPEALIMLSPFGAVVEALSQAKLEKLDAIAKEIRTSLAKVKFSGSTAALGQTRLTPLDYQRLFDPGFVQLVAIDPVKAKTAWDGTPDKVIREVRDAIGRSGSQMPPEAKQQLEGQIVMALQRLEPQRPLMEQVEKAPRVAELMGHLFGTVAGTAAAPEEFWTDVAMPLLHIGAPEQFPPLGEEELGAARQGIEPLFLFLEAVPYQSPAQEEGLLGAFGMEDLQMPHPGFKKVGSLRLIKVSKDRIKPLLERFDPEKTRNALSRFEAYVKEKSGTGTPPGGEGAQLLDAALSVLKDLKEVVGARGDLCLRRITEAEAASDGALSLVRDALQGPRIILA